MKINLNKRSTWEDRPLEEKKKYIINWNIARAIDLWNHTPHLHSPYAMDRICQIQEIVKEAIDKANKSIEDNIKSGNLH